MAGLSESCIEQKVINKDIDFSFLSINININSKGARKTTSTGNGKSLSWTGLTREWWCCTIGLVSRLDMGTCQTSIKTDILL